MWTFHLFPVPSLSLVMLTCNGRAKQFGRSRWELARWGASGMGRDYTGGGAKSEWEVAGPGGRQEEGHGLGLR